MLFNLCGMAWLAWHWQQARGTVDPGKRGALTLRALAMMAFRTSLWFDAADPAHLLVSDEHRVHGQSNHARDHRHADLRLRRGEASSG